MAKKRKPNQPGNSSIHAPQGAEVEFFYEASNAKTVCVAGDFNAWNSTSLPLHHDGSGRWRLKVAVPKGHHEYRLVVDGEWRNDPRARGLVLNKFGSFNCVLVA